MLRSEGGVEPLGRKPVRLAGFAVFGKGCRQKMLSTLEAQQSSWVLNKNSPSDLRFPLGFSAFLFVGMFLFGKHLHGHQESQK